MHVLRYPGGMGYFSGNKDADLQAISAEVASNLTSTAPVSSLLHPLQLCFNPLPTPLRASSPPYTPPNSSSFGTMAPLTDQVVDDLKNLVQKLETRVSELEAKLTGGNGSSASSSSSMRMILMGPPGAGTLHNLGCFGICCWAR